MAKEIRARFSKGVLEPLEKLELREGEVVTITILNFERPKTLRPFGLCAGEFSVPDDFDDPLPEDVIKGFEEA